MATKKIRLNLSCKNTASFHFFAKIESTAKKTDSFMERKGKITLLSSILSKEMTILGKLESSFQAELKKEIEKRFPGAVVFKIETYIQGFPDLGILYKNKWAVLECKKSRTAKKQPNQDYYVNHLNEMSFSRFIYPENKEEVLRDLQRAFES